MASINSVQRILDWTDVHFYCARRGKVVWPQECKFANEGEFELAEVDYMVDGMTFKTTLWAVGGHIFSFVTRPSVKSHCFGSVANVVVKLRDDPDMAEPSTPDLHEFLPESYRYFVEQQESSDTLNGWNVWRPNDTHIVHFAAGDFVVLAERERSEWLLAPKISGANEIYQCDTDAEPQLLESDFLTALQR